jgi:cation diffusion facilitator CzcD-associated flavoprotein CzcO
MEKSLKPVSDDLLAEARRLDLDAYRARYREERDKRVRTEGRDQYASIARDFPAFSRDPHADPDFRREPEVRDVDVVVIGGGLSGLSMSARLRQAEIDDIAIIEKGADFGGTWYWNRYPGLRCDTDACVYLPLLEETGYVPSEKYVLGREILQHAQRIGRHFDLYSRALFQTMVRKARWDSGEALWVVTTDRGDTLRGRYLVQTVGVLDSPKLPGVAGIERFEGKMFHTSRWDYSYTGGSITGGLSKLADKRVAVIGTGCTAVQCVPYLAESAEHLYVFQRTPSVVDERGNRPTDPEWAKSLKPGWHQRRRENFVALTSGIPQDEDLVDDGWTRTFRGLSGFVAEALADGQSAEEIALRSEISDVLTMNGIRARVDSIVQDPATASALKPWYRYFCKRPTFSDTYLQTFNRPNVTLVATNGAGVDSVTEKGLMFDGVEYPVDCIIFSTGFEVGTALSSRIGFEIVGRDGQSLSQKWSNGFRTLHGIMSQGFPNFFFTGVNQNGLSLVLTYSLDEQAEHIVALIKRAFADTWRVIEPTAEAEADWNDVILETSAPTREFQSQCTPGYFNNEGQTQRAGAAAYDVYGGSPIEFYRMVREWRSGSMYGLRTEKEGRVDIGRAPHG